MTVDTIKKQFTGEAVLLTGKLHSPGYNHRRVSYNCTKNTILKINSTFHSMGKIFQIGLRSSSKNYTKPFANQIYNLNKAEELRCNVSYISKMYITKLSRYPVISPIRNPTISSSYGICRHHVYKARKFHVGIDFAKAKETSVYTTGSGIVVCKGYNSRCGNFIEIQHAGCFSSLYAHLSKTPVSAGDTVRMGKYIA